MSVRTGYDRKVPGGELADRLRRFCGAMDGAHPDWEMCVISGSVNMYYFTGTIQDGALIIERDKGAVFWVRRSYERALAESAFGDIRRMNGFRDAAGAYSRIPDTVYLDMSEATMQWYGIFIKYFPFKKALPADAVLQRVRSVKSPYEADILRRAGGLADRLLREEVPALLRDGMTEAELGADILALFIKNGHHGVHRFSARNNETLLGHIGFSESPLTPSMFNSASGLAGLYPAAPVLGSRNAALERGDLVYVDIVFGLEGYNADKTLVYSFGKPQPRHVEDVHRHCLELEALAASMLRPGVTPSQAYATVCEAVRPELRGAFMGAAGRTVPFVGHGVGLYVDERPVIADGFGEPLEPGMAIAIEPKIAVEGAGLVGSENTYLVTDAGAECLTGGVREIILI